MLSCSACGPAAPPGRIAVPPRYLSCTAEPVPPSPSGAGGKYTDAQAADYLIDALDAGADCRNKVAAIAAMERAASSSEGKKE
ncbi:hypothetical protein YGS_C1P0340 [Sphingobium sp. YG1]|nr:hypothetical protein YGS_C1P0340 [Sphingobium sp. YG1]